MDEVWLRVVLVAGAFLAAGGIAMARRHSRRPVRSIRSLHLDPGVYLFTSEGCATCDEARAKLRDSSRSDFVEVVWEQEPDRFEALTVDAVPSVLVVDEGGHGRLYPGRPGRVLRAL